MNTVVPIILCGGTGTRLWPLSRKDRPKQLISLWGDQTLLEETLERAKLIGAIGPICVSAAGYGAEVGQILERLDLKGRLLLEPQPRNTAPALTAASLVARGIDPDAIIVALPADHVIEDNSAFEQSIGRACSAAKMGWLTILGVKPRNASSALGYIELAEGIEGLAQIFRVKRFVEKPEQKIAESLISGGALWNAGIVVARADTIVEAVRQHEPDVLASVERSIASGETRGTTIQLGANEFAAAPMISFDKAVLERYGSVAVTSLDATWRDVGTWSEVAELYAADAGGNRRMGRTYLSSSRDTFIFSPNRLTVGIGLRDTVVVDTPDALLVANRDDLGLLRKVVDDLAAEAYPEAATSISSIRPDRHHGKHGCGGIRGALPVLWLSLRPRETTRLAAHSNAANYWIVLQGKVKVTIGKRVSNHGVNQCFHVPPGLPHTISTVGKVPVKLVQLQLT